MDCSACRLYPAIMFYGCCIVLSVHQEARVGELGDKKAGVYKLNDTDVHTAFAYKEATGLRASQQVATLADLATTARPVTLSS